MNVRQINPELVLAERLANLLDNQFRLGTWGFGLDAFIDLLPVGGDVIILLLSLYLVFVGWRLGLPQSLMTKMLLNIGLAFAVGLIPIIGDVAYIAFRPNMRNLQILKQHVDTV